MSTHRVYKNIKALRELNRFSMADMAESLNISPSSYFQLEKGNSKATIERLEEIAQVLGVSLSHLIGSEESMEEAKRITDLEMELEEKKRIIEILHSSLEVVTKYANDMIMEENKRLKKEGMDDLKVPKLPKIPKI
ncbi:hypothetical protein EMA8858_00519 [Emticicia aquatica]|uniref:HTH cro/C1-type domain-containing protein n=1 Tax=Emticicia aquatica TaxID=1681835 RepID=A0ABN8EP44_9BACT|nr:helix-turn-helix transcriptional regulator [Emticicia aquatica]CAH0994410.1 hypothetical protein EMA8858_00519 [Emticicia aquatica]